MSGGGVQPGRLIGGTDENGDGPDVATDIEPDDLGVTILHALGIDHHKEYFTKTGPPGEFGPSRPCDRRVILIAERPAGEDTRVPLDLCRAFP